MKDTLKSVGSSVEEFTRTGRDAEVIVPTELPNENTNVSPCASVSGAMLSAATHRKALTGCPTAKSVGFTLKFTFELVCESAVGTSIPSNKQARKAVEIDIVLAIRISHKGLLSEKAR